MKKIIIFLLCLPAFAQAALIEVTLGEQGLRTLALPGNKINFFLNPSIVDGAGNAFEPATDVTITIFSGDIDLSNELDFITVASSGNILGNVFVNNSDLDPNSNPVSPLFEFYQTLVIPNLAIFGNVVEFNLTYSNPLSETGFTALRIGGSYFYDDGSVAVNAPTSPAILLIGLFGLALTRVRTKR